MDEDARSIHLNIEKIDNASFNDSCEVTIDMLWDFYNHFHGESNYLLIILYVPVIALAIVANFLVIAVVFKYHYMRSVTNYFVVNLSVADLLVTTVCMPVAIKQSATGIWNYGEFMCKFWSFLQGVSVAASVFTITAMSIDRYLAIRSPIAFRRIFNRRSTLIVIIILWLGALLIFVPVFIGRRLEDPLDNNQNLSNESIRLLQKNCTKDPPPSFTVCSEDFWAIGIEPQIFGLGCFILVYALPGFVVIVAYSLMGRTLCARKPPFDCDSVEGSASSQQSFRLVRERRRIAWILLLLAVLFALCWLPYNVLRLLIDISAVQGVTVKNASKYCLFLGHANSALNPVVYCFMTRNFRRSVREILRCVPRNVALRRPLHGSIPGTAVVNGVCANCGAPIAGGVGGTWRGILRQRKMLLNCRCAIPLGRHRTVLTRRQTSSSGYDSLYKQRACYMLKGIRTGAKPPTDQRTHETNTNPVNPVVNHEDNQEDNNANVPNRSDYQQH